MPLLSYIDIRFYLYFLYFIFVVITSFGLPGYLFIYKYKLSVSQKIILALLTGMIIWAYLAYLSNYLHIVWIIYMYLLSCIVIFIFLQRNKQIRFSVVLTYKNSVLNVIKTHKLIVALLLLGTFAQYSSLWGMGILDKDGLTFCCRSVPDNLFHLGITHSLLLSFPPQEPGMEGTIIHNYYYASHIIIATLISIFHLPLITTQVNFIPLYLSVMIGCSIIFFSKRLDLSNTTTALLLFFFYFHTDLYYIFFNISYHVWDPTVKMLDNGTELLAAPPLAFGMLFFLATLIYMHTWVNKRNFYSVVLVAMAVALLVATKIYIAIFTFIGLFCVSLFLVLKDKKFTPAIPFLLSLCLALCFYLPVNTSAGGLFYSGFWRVTDFASQPPVGLIKMVTALQVYQEHHNVLRIVLIIGFFTVVYLITVFGTLFIALFQSKKSLQIYPVWLHIFFLPAAGITLTLSLLTLQKTGGANTIQFIIFLMYIGAFYAAIAISRLLTVLPRFASMLLLVLLFALSAPQIISNVILNITPSPNKDIMHISNTTLTAISKLQKSSDKNDVIAVDKNFLGNTDYFYSVLLDRRIYLTGTGILEDHGVNDSNRKKVIEQLPESLDTLQKQHVRYIIVKNIPSHPSLSKNIFYQDSELIIYKFN